MNWFQILSNAFHNLIHPYAVYKEYTSTKSLNKRLKKCHKGPKKQTGRDIGNKTDFKTNKTEEINKDCPYSSNYLNFCFLWHKYKDTCF